MDLTLPVYHQMKLKLFVRMKKIDKTKVKTEQKTFVEVFPYIVAIDDLSDVTQSEILEECGVKAIR